jgi:uncharacterized membrane protein
MDKGRLEAFSDGVIAVAITLLVLNVSVPMRDSLQHGQTLLDALGQRWPQYAAYVTSFLTVGIIWINHHAMISRLREADHTILIANLLLLMTIVVIPFSTNLMATYLHGGTMDQANLAAAVYGGTLLLMAFTFSLLNRQILLARAHLMHEAIPLADRRAIYRRAASGVIPYIAATALAAASAYATLIIAGVLVVFYATPIASSTQASQAPSE